MKLNVIVNQASIDTNSQEFDKFIPRPIWVAEDVQPNFLYKYQQDGGSLYMVEDLKNNMIGVSPNFSTDLDGAVPVQVSMDYVTQEVRIKEGHDPLLPSKMTQHVKDGGKLYSIGEEKNGVLFVSCENPASGNMTNETPSAYMLPTDIEFVDISMAEQDFADAVANIPESGQGMKQ